MNDLRSYAVNERATQPLQSDCEKTTAIYGLPVWSMRAPQNEECLPIGHRPFLRYQLPVPIALGIAPYMEPALM
jgi:hypothetical protein